MKARLGWTARLASTLGMLALAPAAAPPSQRPPNFVFIQGEAQGPSSISVDMDGDPASPSRPSGLTPNLEKLASNGMRFSDFYASCPRCTPSRASFVTGISPAKLHMTYQNEGGASRREGGAKGGGKANDGGEGVEDASKYRLMRMIPPQIEPDLPPGVKTSGARLGELGYGTAHFGKWHAGRAEPSKVGFDRCDGANSNQGPERGVAPNPKQATVITDKGIAFMREQVKAGKPFFVQISHYGFGSEEEATPEALAVAKRLVPGVSGKPLGAIAGAHDVDTQVGRVVAALKEMGVADNTYIFYSADHGAQGGGGGGRSQANPPFSGGKGSVREGGIRVPLIAAGPGIQAGTVSHVRATGMDLLPTMLDLAGHPVPKPVNPDARTEIEGGSLVPVLKGEGKGEVKRSHEEIVIHFPHYDLNNGGPASALYLGDRKLVRNYDSGKVMLFDVSKDPDESNDLATNEAERVKELEKRLDAYLKAVNAQMPTRNTDPKAGTGDPTNMPQSGGNATTQGGKGGGKDGNKGGTYAQ
jgi:arylsulfatase A-like enzyme